MIQSTEVEYLKPFIVSTIDAAARFRRVLIVMVIVSILAFGAFWNSLSETWFNSRIVAARNGEAYLSLEDMRDDLIKTEKDISVVEAKEQKETEEGKKQELEEKKRELKDNQDKLRRTAAKVIKERFDREVPITQARQLEEELQSDVYKGVKEWISKRMMPDKEQAGRYAQSLEQARNTNIILINIPFSGSVFDVNSLGLWAGTTFMVILLIFRFSLWREYNNLRLTFDEARDEHLKFCYRSLAMQQVLTVPPSLTQRQDRLIPQSKVVQLLYLPPFIIQLSIILNDIRTHNIGGLFSSKLAFWSTAVSILLLVVIVILTWKCLKLSYAIDTQWAAAAKRLKGASPKSD